MSSATTISVENAGGTPEVNPWLIGVVVSLAAFMEVLDTSIANVALPHIAGNLPVGFLFVPLTMAGYAGVPKNKTNAAAGLMNFMRNMGQSVGTSAVTTLIARRSQYHQSVLATYTRSPQFSAAVSELTTRLSHAGFDLYSAQQAALSKMFEVLNTQAQALSYIDVYWLLAVTAALMFLLCFLLEKNEPGASATIQVH